MRRRVALRALLSSLLAHAAASARCMFWKSPARGLSFQGRPPTLPRAHSFPVALRTGSGQSCFYLQGREKHCLGMVHSIRISQGEWLKPRGWLSPTICTPGCLGYWADAQWAVRASTVWLKFYMSEPFHPLWQHVSCTDAVGLQGAALSPSLPSSSRHRKKKKQSTHPLSPFSRPFPS